MELGPGRSLAAVAKLYGVSRAAISETSGRYDWPARAEAWDAQGAVTESVKVVATVLDQVAVAGDGEGFNPEFAEALEAFRSEAEAIGRSHTRAARALSAAATKSAARLLEAAESGKPLSAREIAALAGVSAQLATSGVALWGRALGVERMLAQVADVTVAEVD